MSANKHVVISPEVSQALDELAGRLKQNRKASCELAIVTLLTQKKHGERDQQLERIEELLRKLIGVVETW